MKECNCHRGPEVKTKTIGCPPKVIQVNNPPEPVFFHRVDIPAAMGDESVFPPENGLYKNVLLVYEVNDNAYLYNSDGIPTKLTANVEKVQRELGYEVEARTAADTVLQEEIDEIKNNPDVVDVVATKAALDTYDTSTLTDKDVIRVLSDETHDGQSTYYRWEAGTQDWAFIGVAGDYYTKAQTDDLLDAKQDTLTAGNKISLDNNTVSLVGDSITVLSAGDYNYPTNTPDGIAIWLLDDGIYTVDDSQNVKIYYSDSSSFDQRGNIILVNSTYPSGGQNSKMITSFGKAGTNSNVPGAFFKTNAETGAEIVAGTAFLTVKDVVDGLTSVSPVAPLSSNQGRILNENIGDLSTLATTDKTSAVAAINELAATPSVSTISSTDWSNLWQ